MIGIFVTTGDWDAQVRFKYDPQAVAIVKEIPGRRWDPEGKFWQIDVELVDALAQMLTRAGYTVLVDGQPWHTKPGGSSGSSGTGMAGALNVLFSEIPERLRTPTYRALSRVFHPDLDGDTVLMQQLNEAWRLVDGK